MAQLAKPSPVIKGSNLTIHKTFFIIVKNVLKDKNGERVNQNIIMRQRRPSMEFFFSTFSFTKPGFEPKISGGLLSPTPLLMPVVRHLHVPSTFVSMHIIYQIYYDVKGLNVAYYCNGCIFTSREGKSNSSQNVTKENIWFQSKNNLIGHGAKNGSTFLT